jgi:transcription elongation factor Elf1
VIRITIDSLDSGYYNCPFCNASHSVYMRFADKQGYCKKCGKRVRTENFKKKENPEG